MKTICSARIWRSRGMKYEDFRDRSRKMIKFSFAFDRGGCQPVDGLIRSGMFFAKYEKAAFPRCPGRHIALVVERLGDKDPKFRVAILYTHTLA